MHCRKRSTLTWCGRLGLFAFVVGSSLTPSGAPATVQEQRARLPPPAQCSDPVAGIWRSHSYDERYVEWTIFTLEIHRDEDVPSRLRGTIVNESWDGTPEDSQPGPCRDQRHYEVSMPARGTVQDGEIEFSGVETWKFDERHCGRFDTFYYNLDSFSGVIDPELLEFQSVNNDGGRAVDHPVVFRRVACHESERDDEAPSVAVTPPAFYPPEDTPSGGCGCFASKGRSP